MDIGIHLFHVSSASNRDLFALLRRIGHTPKDRRWRHVQRSDIGLQDTRFDQNKGLVLLDFVKRRPVGPGKVRSSGDVEAFDFQDGEEFGEETAAIFDVRRGWLVVQYNQHGVRIASIMDYLNLWDHDPESDFVYSAVLDDAAEARLRHKDFLRAAHIRVKLTNSVTAAMREQGDSLGTALVRAAQEASSTFIEVKLGKSHQQGRLDGGVLGLLRRLSALPDGDVSRLQVKSRAGENGEDEVIDLLKHRIRTRYSSRDLEIRSGRYTLDSRWRALLRVHTGWAQELG